MFAGDTRAALEANAKAVSMYPPYDRTCYNNSAFALALDGRAEEALAWFRKAKALRPDYPAIDHYMSRAYWMDEEFDSVWAVLERGMLRQDPAARNKSRVILACLQYSQGKLRTAEQLAMEGIRECRAQGKSADEAYFHLILGEVAAVGGELDKYRRELASVVRLSRSPHFDLALAGISLARRGNITEAEEILRRVDAAESFDPSFLRYRRNFLELLRGEIDLGRGRVQEGRRHFETVDKVQSGDPFYWIAQKGLADCAARASDTSAAALYGGVLARRGEIVMGSLSSIRQAGVWIRWLWPETLLDLGEFYVARGRVGQATASLDAARNYWNGADESDFVARRARTLQPAPKREP
jgi:tetratricopeptide (TPR) repeat protein